MSFVSHKPLRLGCIAFAAVSIAGAVTHILKTPQAAAAASDSGQRRPVLVELFTSEGCSSCPPADALLARLDAQQFIPGAEAIVLSEHVTYWDRLGWRDPFSLDEVTDRQHAYADRFGLDSVYTPQVVVNGAVEMVGSDAAGLARAVARAAAAGKAIEPAVDLEIQDAQWSGDAVKFKVRAAGVPGADATLTAVLAEDSAQSSVARGENAGHTLRHVAVVRAIKEMGKGALDGRALTLKLPNAVKAGPLRLVAFVADRRSGHVLASVEQTLKGPGPDPGRGADGLQATSLPAPASQ